MGARSREGGGSGPWVEVGVEVGVRLPGGGSGVGGVGEIREEWPEGGASGSGERKS